MPIDKNKLIRYKVLDQCLCDLSRTYCVGDLLQVVNAELERLDQPAVSRRTIQNDLQTLKYSPFNVEFDEEMYAAHVYRYADTSFHLSLVHLLPADMDTLRRSIDILHRYLLEADEQTPQYLWLLIMLQLIAGGNELQAVEQYVSFEHNSVFAGNAHFAMLLECVINHRPIVVRYQPYGREVMELHLHPYHLKQFNNRWFLFAKEEKIGVANLALDRIHSIRPWQCEFEPSDVDFTAYFDNMIGVSHSDDMAVETIVLRVANKRYPYVETKPFSDRQHIVSHDNESHTITFPMQVNNELVAELLSFGADIEVLQPQHLRERMRAIAEQCAIQYSSAQKPCTQM